MPSTDQKPVTAEQQATRQAPKKWRPPSTESPMWNELSIEARRNGWVLQRALNPNAARTRGRYFFRDRFANSIVHGAASLKDLRTWLMASPEQRLRTQQHNETKP